MSNTEVRSFVDDLVYHYSLLHYSFSKIKRINADVKAMWRSMSKEAKSTYGKEYVEYHVEAAKHVIETANDDNRLVNDVIEEALFTVQPKVRYMIGGSNRWYDKYKVSYLRLWLTGWLTD